MSQLSIQAMSIIKIISSTFIISALLFAPLAAKASENGTESLYFKKIDEADKACAEGLWHEAENALVEALRAEPANPSNVLLISNLGIIRFNMGQDSLAIATLNDAHSMAPASVTILSNRAKVLAANGYDEEAYLDYSRIIELDSLEISARLPRCLYALRRHDFRTAKSDMEFMEQNFPGKIETEIAGAAVRSGTGDFAGAIPYYSRILLERKDPEYYSGRAYCYLLTGSLQEASDDINSALAITPADGELYLYRAALNKMRYRPADAEADARKAVELGVDKTRATQFLSNQISDTMPKRK
ncbi:tetratricopeptide repeat protein [uncultured Duncaniella sp.]|jgi:tetratricopeptide (TPR) repeat protein|uniref:tetratricopeptide repeat protein n=2 Tax=uncultured Duncaniella sp. TaxID=2768039 RepID=UPI0026B4CD62|nr:hypothetical protein [uncultured Duncaniella sp.]